MRTIGLIPARGGSKRLPRKNVRYMAGKPLIFWTIEAALASNLDAVYVSTEDDEVRDICRDFVRVIDRPAEFSTDTAPSEGVVMHALHLVRDCDRLMLLQPTSPLRTAGHINDALLMDTCVSGYMDGFEFVYNGAIYLMHAKTPMVYDERYIMDRDVSIDIDTQADFDAAEWWLTHPEEAA